MDGIIQKVITWAEDTNIVGGSDLKAETLKLTAEYGGLIECLNQHLDCRNGIGQCIIQMVIICRMQNFILSDCIINIKELTDRRIVNRRFVVMMATQYLGKLNKNILNHEDIRVSMGYLFIYLAALTKIFNYFLRECIEVAHSNIIKKKGVMFDGNFIEETDEGYQAAMAVLKSRKKQVNS